MLDDLSAGHEWAVKWGPLVEGSTGDRNLVRTLLRDHQPEAVIHFAANAYVGESMQNPAKYFHNNVVNALSLLDVLVEDGRAALRVLIHLCHLRNAVGRSRSPRPSPRSRSTRTASPS